MGVISEKVVFLAPKSDEVACECMEGTVDFVATRWEEVREEERLKPSLLVKLSGVLYFLSGGREIEIEWMRVTTSPLVGFSSH